MFQLELNLSTISLFESNKLSVKTIQLLTGEIYVTLLLCYTLSQQPACQLFNPARNIPKMFALQL